ncbi:MAG: SRPBCC family protein [Anaerolineae bacterium]
MAKVERSITINAPVEKVFGYWTQPTNLPEIWPSLLEVKEVQRLPNGGNRVQSVYKMAGMRFEVTTEDTEYVPNQRTVTKVEGGIEGTITWTFQPEDGGTKLTTETEYTVPIPLLGKLAEAFIVKANEREVDLLLANLKARMEA